MKRLFIMIGMAGVCAASCAVVAGNTEFAGKARFTLLTDRMVRCEWSEDGSFEDRPSLTFVNRVQPPVKHTFTRMGEGAVLETDGRSGWRRIPESHAKIDVPVPVEVEFASDGAEVRVRYTVDDAVSGWLGICGGGSLHGVEATCRLHALSARYANVLGDGRFAIVLR